MGRKYANPPLIEAVCEFRLTSDTSWDLTIPGLLYEHVKDRFPHREQRVVQEVGITRTPQGLQHQIRTSERIVLFTKDRKAFVQLGPRVISIHCLRPYPTWARFKPMIEMAFSALTQTVEVKGLQRIGLRYVNRIEIPGSAINLEDYFQFYPFVGPQLPQNIDKFMVHCEFSYYEGRDRCRLQLASAPQTAPDQTACILDIDYFLAREKGVDVQEVGTWIEDAHDKIEEVFEGCISDALRTLFKEVKQDA